MYLDANFLVFAAVGIGLQSERARALARRISSGEIDACTSALALDEAMWVLRKNGQNALVRPVIEELYQMQNLTITEVPAHIPLGALRFIEEHNLKPRDAFHAAIMEHFNISEIATDDRDFDKIPGIKRIRI